MNEMHLGILGRRSKQSNELFGKAFYFVSLERESLEESSGANDEQCNEFEHEQILLFTLAKHFLNP